MQNVRAAGHRAHPVRPTTAEEAAGRGYDALPARAYPYSAQAGWEETGCIAAKTSREALAMRDNAPALYHLP